MAPMTRMMMAALIALALSGPGHADPQLRIYPSTATTGAMYPLKPGLYGGGTIYGALHPRAEFLHITRVSASDFQGTLEIMRVTADGHLLDVKGPIAGTITPRPGNVPYIDITTLDDPLHALMPGMHGPIVSDGLGMSWSGHAEQLGDNPGGGNDRLVPMSEESRAKLLAGFQHIADEKVVSIKEQEASIPIVEQRIDDFLKMSEAWVNEKPDTYPDDTLAKMKALYAQEKAIASNRSHADPQQLKFEETPVALEIGTLINAYSHYEVSRQREEVFRETLLGSASMFQNSPCLEGTGDQVALAAARCKELAAPIAAFKARTAALRKVINDEHATFLRVDRDIECTATGAEVLLNEYRTLPSYCPKDDAATAGLNKST